MSPAGWLTLTLVVLLGVIALAIVGAWQFGSGLDQKGAFAARNPRSELEREQRRVIVVLDRLLRRTNLGQGLARRLSAAGMSMRPVVFLLLLTGVIVVAVALAWRYLAPFFALLTIAAAVWAALRLLRFLENRRREQFIGQLPELARLLSNSFAAGLALRTGIDVAAEELDDPAKTELRKVADAMKLGQSTEDALEDLGQRLPSRELTVLVSTLVISARAGGSMVTALRNISTTLEARKEVRREVKTVLAQAVTTSYVVIAMGVGSLLIINKFVEGGLRVLTSNIIGIGIVLIASTLFVLGFILTQRMAKVDI